MTMLFALIGTLVFAIVAPVLGCLLAGLDRKISARMQGRVGPPLLQPYYDVRKLIEKDNVSVNSTEAPTSRAPSCSPSSPAASSSPAATC